MSHSHLITHYREFKLRCHEEVLLGWLPETGALIDELTLTQVSGWQCSVYCHRNIQEYLMWEQLSPYPVTGAADHFTLSQVPGLIEIFFKCQVSICCGCHQVVSPCVRPPAMFVYLQWEPQLLSTTG